MSNDGAVYIRCNSPAERAQFDANIAAIAAAEGIPIKIARSRVVRDAVKEKAARVAAKGKSR